MYRHVLAIQVCLCCMICNAQQDVATLQANASKRLAALPLKLSYISRVATADNPNTVALHGEEVILDGEKVRVRQSISGKYTVDTVFDGKNTRVLTERIDPKTGKKSYLGTEKAGRGRLPGHLDVKYPYMNKWEALARARMTTDTANGKVTAKADFGDSGVDIIFDMKHGGMVQSERIGNGVTVLEHLFSDPVSVSGVDLPTSACINQIDADGQSRVRIEYSDVKYSVLSEDERAKAFVLEFPAGTDRSGRTSYVPFP